MIKLHVKFDSVLLLSSTWKLETFYHRSPQFNKWFTFTRYAPRTLKRAGSLCPFLDFITLLEKKSSIYKMWKNIQICWQSTILNANKNHFLFPWERWYQSACNPQTGFYFIQWWSATRINLLRIVEKRASFYSDILWSQTDSLHWCLPVQ